MGKKKSFLPTAKERRVLLAEEAIILLKLAGRNFIKAKRLGEALECIEKTKDKEGLNKLVDLAIEIGDYFIWKKALIFFDREITIEEIEHMAMRAEALGKSTFAIQARSQKALL